MSIEFCFKNIVKGVYMIHSCVTDGVGLYAVARRAYINQININKITKIINIKMYKIVSEEV